MNILIKYGIVFYLTMFFQAGNNCIASNAEKPDDIQPVAWWSFDSCKFRTISGGASDINDSIQGNFKLVRGISGKALKLDGFTTCVTRDTKMAPGLGDSFTFEAWIAAATYPWNWCPVIAQGIFEKKGYYFGVGPQGQVGIFASVDGIWQRCETIEKIELKKWIHLAAIYDKKDGDFWICGKRSDG